MRHICRQWFHFPSSTTFFQTLLKPITKHCLCFTSQCSCAVWHKKLENRKNTCFLGVVREQKSNIQGNSSNMCVIPKTEKGFLYKTLKTRQVALGSPRYEYIYRRPHCLQFQRRQSIRVDKIIINKLCSTWMTTYNTYSRFNNCV